MAAAHYHLDNLLAIVDHNRYQIDGAVNAVMDLGDLSGKWRAFGWNVLEVDGHAFPALTSAYARARETKSQPTVILAITCKGKGCSFMENTPHAWHGTPPTREQLERALGELAR